ncbi:MAG TPA: hypothetical protein PLY87_02055 [Planctomycetaceae bacterium]|nr:hypothetical protein [Planctomycetaceae bacterium]
MIKLLDYSGKAELVTRVASGMGLVTAQAFAEAGVDSRMIDAKP